MLCGSIAQHLLDGGVTARFESRMSGNQNDEATSPGEPAPVKKLTPEAERALAEAEARRAAQAREAVARPKEIAGRDGPDPARYGDWENKGITSDF